VAQSLSKVYLHIIFSTKDRRKFIESRIEMELYKYIAGILKNMKCTTIKIGGMSDHIHILNTLPRTITQSEMIGILKKDSSKWIKTKGNNYTNFHWQNGFGVFSVSESKVNIVKSYIEDQQKHHKMKSFKEEYREFLKEYNMKYEERYVWD